MLENKIAIYITKYNDIENLLNKLPDAPSDANMKWLEDQITDIKIKNKLYLCRILRNYIQHNSDFKEFISITDTMIDFLDEIKSLVLNKLTLIKTVMIPKKKLIIKKLSDSILETIIIMNSKNIDCIPIIDDNETVLTIFTKDDALQLFEKEKIKKSTKFKDLDQKKELNKNKVLFKFSSENKLIDEIIDLFTQEKPIKLLIITDSGNSKGKIIGLLSKEDLI